ncbi:MAG: hypothetical protein K2Q18_18660 [Bdellovibrionales bacterium]|nr:hypothetical protein [Bdellovibrionales bacterium]
MNEDELQRKRKEFRDQEVMGKINEYSAANQYRHQVLKTNYTYKRVDKRFGKVGWTLIGTQAMFLVLFCFLFIFSYIPATKKIVSMVMP